MARFQKGQSGNIKGKPIGTKSRKQFSLTFWFNLLISEYSKINHAQRAKIAFECWKVLINKAKQLPVDPADSKFNATQTMGLLKDVEAQLTEKANLIEKPESPQ